MIDKYLIDYSGITIGVKFNPVKKELIIGTKQRYRPNALLLINTILGINREKIKDVVYRQGNRVRFLIDIQDVNEFHETLDNLNTTSFNVVIKQVKKIHTSIM